MRKSLGPLPLLIHFDALIFSCRVQSLLLRHGVFPIHGSRSYLEFFCSLCWHALSGVSGAERLRHVLKVFATTYLLFYLFETRTVLVGGRLGYMAMSQAY